MAVRQKTGSKTRKTVRKTARKTMKTMNQFATAARRKTKALGRDAEAVVENAGEWVGHQASNVGGAVKRNPGITIALAAVAGLAGWFVARHTVYEYE